MIQTKKTRTIRPPSLLPERVLSHTPMNGCKEILNILDNLSSKGSKKQKKRTENSGLNLVHTKNVDQRDEEEDDEEEKKHEFGTWQDECRKAAWKAPGIFVGWAPAECSVCSPLVLACRD
jgi:hypothetical protein